MAKCRIGTAKFFTLLMLLYHTLANVEGILRKEIGMVFAQVLEDAGVYKLDESGREGFVRFLASVK